MRRAIISIINSASTNNGKMEACRLATLSTLHIECLTRQEILIATPSPASNSTSCKRDFCARLRNLCMSTLLLWGVLCSPADDACVVSVLGVKEQLLLLRWRFLPTSNRACIDIGTQLDSDIFVSSNELVLALSAIDAQKLFVLPRQNDRGFHASGLAKFFSCDVRKMSISFPNSRVGEPKRFVGLILCKRFCLLCDFLHSAIFLLLSSRMHGAVFKFVMRWRGGVIGMDISRASFVFLFPPLFFCCCLSVIWLSFFFQPEINMRSNTYPESSAFFKNTSTGPLTV